MVLHRLPAAVLLVGLAGVVRGETVVAHPYRGITLIERTERVPRAEHMHMVEVELGEEGIGFKLSPVRPIGGSETRGQTTVDYLVEEHAQLAVNAHFFGFPLKADGGTNREGFAASTGDVYSGFDGAPALNYALLPNVPVLNIDARNHARVAARGSNATALVDAASGRPLEAYNALTGSAQIITQGRVTIPEGLPPRPRTRPADPEVSFYRDQVAARTAAARRKARC